MTRRTRGQSLVELALVAPVLILMAMLAWDGGSVLREQVILDQAARDGARAAATSYAPGGSIGSVTTAVLQSAADLPALAATPGFVTMSNPDAQSVQVTLTYDHPLWTPVLRNLWAGGSGTLRMHATATFFVPRLTPVPSPVVVSTPLPTATPTMTPTATPTALPPTATPTVTPTATATANPVLHCTVTIPPLANNSGAWIALQTTATATISTTWTMRPGDTRNLEIDIYQVFPFDQVATGRDNNTRLTVTTGVVDPNWYAIFYYNRGGANPSTTTATIDFVGSVCP